MRSLYDREIRQVADYVKQSQSEVEALHPDLQSYCGYRTSAAAFAQTHKEQTSLLPGKQLQLSRYRYNVCFALTIFTLNYERDSESNAGEAAACWYPPSSSTADEIFQSLVVTLAGRSRLRRRSRSPLVRAGVQVKAGY